MKKILLIILSLLSLQAYSQCAGVTSTGTTKASTFKSCRDTVIVSSSLNTVVADTVTLTQLTITGLGSGLVKVVSGTASMAISGTDYVVPSGSISGNAATATQLQTARTISSTGDVIYTTSFNGTANVTGAAAVTWANGKSTYDTTYTLKLKRTSDKTSNYTAVAGDLVPCNTTSGSFTITLPSAPANNSRILIKHIIQGGTNIVSIVCSGSDVFNKTGGGTTITLSLLNQGYTFQYSTIGIWIVTASDYSLGSLDSRFLATTQLGSSVLEADATNFVTGVSTINPYYRNKEAGGKYLSWNFTNGTTGWSSSGSGTTWAINGNYLQASGGGGASDYTNFYKYDSYQIVSMSGQVEVLTFIPTIDATNAGEGFGVGIKNNDTQLDFLVKVDLSNTASRGQISIYKVIAGTPTLLLSSVSNSTTATAVSFTTNSDNLSLKLTKRIDGYLHAKLVNNSTGNSVSVIGNSTGVSAGVSRVSKMAIYHFGGTIKIPVANLKSASPKSKKIILVGDSVTNGYANNGFMTQAYGDAFLEAGSGSTSTDIVNSLDEIINSGAQHAILMIGMNDAGNSITTATYMANVRLIVDGLQESGIIPIICYVTPSGNSTRNGFIQGYNTALLNEYNGIYQVIDNYSILSVGNNLTGLLQAGFDSGDGIHPNTAGYLILISNIQNNIAQGQVGIGIPFLGNPARSTNIQTFTASGVWTKPNRARSVWILCIAGGGGGGSGRKSASGTLATGGGGGGGGSASMITLDASVLSATVNITIGAGGIGGASQTTNSTDGNAGVDGANTNFASYLGANKGLKGGAGTAVGAGSGGGANTSMFTGSNGGSSSATGGVGSNGALPGGYCGTGAGSGGGITTGAVANIGGNGGGSGSIPTATSGTGGAVNTIGGAGSTLGYLGTGAGGGGASTTTNAGAGGAGGSYGGGGGGGGATLDGVGNSGAGGAGGNGVCVVITYF